MGGLNAALSLAALLWCLALTLWSLTLHGRSRWIFGVVALLVSIGMLKTLGPNVLQTGVSTNNSTRAPNGQAGAPAADWQDWSVERVENAMASGQPVFVDFTAAWCITCQYNKQTTLSDTEVLQDFADKKVVLLRADWTQRDPLITQALANLGRSGVPVYVLYQFGKPPIVMSEILSSAGIREALRSL
jgi:thiol:disulfide interchange protein DsbD